MPARVIRGEINASDSLSRVSMAADLTFRALIVAADDWGRIDGRLPVLRGMLFPLRAEVTDRKLDGWLDELAAGPDAPILRYAVEGRPFIALNGWEKHRGRTERAKPSRFPAPNGHAAPEPAACVYFVRDPATQRIKIGWTGALTSRLSSIRTTIPAIELLGSIDAETRADEKRIHRRFAHLRVEREWFKGDPELLAFIASCACPGTSSDATGRPGRATLESREGVERRESREREEEGELEGARGALASAAPPPPAPVVRRSTKIPKPSSFTGSDRERIQTWAASRGFDRAALNAGLERFREWEPLKTQNRTMAQWVGAFMRIVREGVDAGQIPNRGPASVRKSNYRAAEDVLAESRRRMAEDDAKRARERLEGERIGNVIDLALRQAGGGGRD